jgi:hypothetical protein
MYGAGSAVPLSINKDIIPDPLIDPMTRQKGDVDVSRRLQITGL